MQAGEQVWYAEDVRVPTLWDGAFDAGLTTALVTWPGHRECAGQPALA
jgi:hypothetical protein